MSIRSEGAIFGETIGQCDKCGDTSPVTKFKNLYLCKPCKSAYKNNLAVPRQVKKEEKIRTRFHDLVDI